LHDAQELGQPSLEVFFVCTRLCVYMHVSARVCQRVFVSVNVYVCAGLAITIHLWVYTYIRCTYGIFSREITIHTVIYGADIRFWPTLRMRGVSHCRQCMSGLGWVAWATITCVCNAVQCAVWGVQCAVCSVQCAVCSVQWQCAVCNVLCSVHCAVCSVQCAVWSVQCAVCGVQCAVCSVRCAVCSVQCAVCRRP